MRVHGTIIANDRLLLAVKTSISRSAPDSLNKIFRGELTTGTETRASVLFKIADGPQTLANGALVFQTRYGKAFCDQQFNPGFVQMEYFGYMKRDPDDAGFAFWLGKLNQFGNFSAAEMVRAGCQSSGHSENSGRIQR